MGRRNVKGFGLLVSLIVLGAMAVPAGAAANLVVNGDFETGTLEGWHQRNEPGGSGQWSTYSGNEVESEIGAPFLVPAPPQGEFAAIATQNDPGLHILYQDVPLGEGSHELSLIAYYESFEPLISQETLSPAEEPNQQYRIDVLKPGVSLTTVDPADILATVFETEEGDPPVMEPTTFTADLSAFGGQTVRLRVAEVDTESPLLAGVDAVSISGSAPPPPAPPAPAPSPSPAPPSNAFTFGKLKLNKKKGTATLQVNVPGAGSLVAADVKKKGKRIKKATATATAAGVTKLILKPTASGMKTLKAKGKLAFKALVTFTPTGGTAAGQTRAGKLKLTSSP
ncbi:MAG TPA: hypothetical protein VFJ53_08340 [Solirubrobacterales bacterium]|nr:hypothetical protein [Solirubrobacterales bacterium]